MAGIVHSSLLFLFLSLLLQLSYCNIVIITGIILSFSLLTLEHLQLHNAL